MKSKYFFFIIGLILLVSFVTALPTTNPVTGNTSSVATFSGTCGTAPCWFSWGYGTNMYWTTPTQDLVGAFTDTQTGSPMLSGNNYNVRACDATGCGNVVSFYVPKSSAINATHFGTNAFTIMRSGFDVFTAAQNVITPYSESFTGVFGTSHQVGTSIMWGIFFFILFVGYWLRGKGIMLPAILAIMSGTVIIGSPIAVDPMFMSAGLPLLAIGLGGVFVSWISNK